MDPRAAVLRQMRIFHAIFVAAVFLLVQTSESLAHTGTTINPFIVGSIAIMACFDLMIAAYMQAKRTILSSEKLTRDPSDANALQQWRSGVVLVLTLTMSVALYGLVLRILGASRPIAWTFFLVALGFMLLWRPKLDVERRIPDTQNLQ